MVKIDISNDENYLTFQASGPQFVEIIESFKYANLRYSSKHKIWLGEIGLYQKYKEQLNEYDIEESEYVKEFIKKWYNSITELRKTIKRSEYRRFIPELMKVPPIISK